MALLFSAVTVTANDKKVEFLVGGIPREFSDLEGWTAFERFMEDISEDTTVKVHAEANLYWSKCEWEIILSPWPPRDGEQDIKVDVYDQIKINWDHFVDYVWNERKNIKYEEPK